MTESNVSTVRELYAALAARDLDAFAARLHPEVDWQTPGAVPWGGSLRGVDAVRRYITDVWGFFDSRTEMRGLAALDEQVTVSGVHLGRAFKGDAFEVPFVDVCTLREGVVVRWRQQVDAGVMVRALAAELAA